MKQKEEAAKVAAEKKKREDAEERKKQAEEQAKREEEEAKTSASYRPLSANAELWESRAMMAVRLYFKRSVNPSDFSTLSLAHEDGNLAHGQVHQDSS